MPAVKQRKYLIWTLAILCVIAVALVITALCLPKRQPPEETAPIETTEATLPPPESNPYGPMDFQYDGKYLTCLAGESVLGIDVSSHQGIIDWAQVAQAGIKFAMIRVGYRGYETGAMVYDQLAEANYQGAKAAGLQVGAYFFSQATSRKEAREEAAFFLEGISGWELEMPAVYDWEYIDDDARTGDLDRRTVTDCTLSFCQAVQAAGYQPMVYFNRHQAADFLYLEELTAYPFWLAMYSDRMTYPHKLAMWQYTSTGSVPGIAGDVDIDLYFPE